MCMPKAPKEDPEIKRMQAEQRRRELDRVAEEKKKALVATRRSLRGGGARSLITGSESAGYGANYTQ